MSKPLETAALMAVGEMSLLKFFPVDEFAKVALVNLLCRMASDPMQLKWLAQTMIDNYTEWPGPQQLRAVFCTRFKPADGKECGLDASVPGSARMLDAFEQRAMESHESRKQLAAPAAEILALAKGVKALR